MLFAMQPSCGGPDATLQQSDAASTLLPIVCPEKARNPRFFDGMVFAFAGRFKVEQGALKRMVEKGGGICAASVTLKVTHVITTKATVEAEKRSTAITTAIERSLPLLHEDFLTRCVEEGELLNLHKFRLGAAMVDRQARCVARPEASSASFSLLYPRESALEKGGSAVYKAAEKRVPLAPFPCNSISINQGWGSLPDDDESNDASALGSQKEIDEDDFVEITGA
jgi:hypothetical protein